MADEERKKDENPRANEKHWSTLIERIRDGNCTPILGAGIACETLPLGRQLAEQLLVEEEAESGEKAPLPDRSDLAKVTEYIAVQERDNVKPKERIARLLKTLGAPDFRSAQEPHRVLADLKLPIYLTTNYDDFMFKALSQSPSVTPIREVARWNTELMDLESKFDSGYEPSPAAPCVFHIHGHWDSPPTMVATEDDYLDFLVNISRDLATSPTDISKKAILPTRIRRSIRSTTLLFIGYSLADVNFRVILRGLIGSSSPALRRMSVSVQYGHGSPGDLQKYMEDYFDHTLKLNVFWYSAQEFCSELKRRMK